MSEAVLNASVTGPDAPEAVVAPAATRPEGLPENFDSVEALVASYKESQAALTKAKAPPATDGLPDNPDAAKTEDNAAEDDKDNQVVSSMPENLQEFSTEFAADGKLADTSYTKLAELGYSKDVVDAYIRGVGADTATAASATTAEDVVAIKASVGGDEQFAALQGWAGENLSDTDLASYNGAIANSATAQMAVEWLDGKMKGAEGFVPTVKVEGGGATETAVVAFKDTAELSRAMQNPLYKAGDKDYHAQIDARLRASPMALR